MPLSWFGTWVQERHDSASSCLNLISIEFAYLFLLSWNSCSAFPYLGSWTCSRATVSPVFSGQQCGSHNMSENHLGYFCVCVCVCWLLNISFTFLFSDCAFSNENRWVQQHQSWVQRYLKNEWQKLLWADFPAWPAWRSLVTYALPIPLSLTSTAHQRTSPW